MSVSQGNIEYPKLLDDYFKNNEVIIKVLPDNYRMVRQEVLSDKKIRTTKMFIDYIDKELNFWSYENLSNNELVASYPNYYNQAKTNIDNAIGCANSDQQQSLRFLQNSINTVVNNCQINSKTELAKLFKGFNKKGRYFFHGFNAALSSNTISNNYYNYNDWHEGFYYGMQYKKAIYAIEKYVESYHVTFTEAVKNTENEISNLYERTNTLFHDQETRIKELLESNEKDLNQQKDNINTFINKKKGVLENLEKTYEGKLQLSKPAEYWKKMSKAYKCSGFGWFVTSIIIALIIISALTLVIIKLPTLFADNKYWLDMIKNTALISVIAGVGIYILRITVRLSMSSFHLSRDAREREQLTGFYLSLLNEEGITEKERALIINSLFSRSDTGLLKGESAPSMSANITELFDKDKSK